MLKSNYFNSILEDGEEIKEYEYKPMNFKCYVSNYGRVFSKLGKELKKTHRWQTYYINVGQYNGRSYKHSYLSLPRMVYKVFVNADLSKNDYVIHKDKNRLNCRADNLDIGLEKRKFDGELPQEKMILFNNPVTLEYVRKKLCKWYDNDFTNIKNGMALDDLIQESLILIYKALYNYKILDDNIENSKCYRKYVYSIVENFICKKYIRDYRKKVNYEI